MTVNLPSPGVLRDSDAEEITVPEPVPASVPVVVLGRLARLGREVGAFGVVGVMNTVVTYAVTNALRFGLGWGLLASTVVATCAASAVGYLGNRLWTFRHRRQRAVGGAYVLFLALNAVGLLIQLVCLGFTTYLLALHGPVAYNAALTVGIAAGTVFRFWSYKKWVFPPPVERKTGTCSTHPA